MTSEKEIQAFMMYEIMERKQHQAVLPNITSLCHWEMDLASITKSRMLVEWEIKATLTDFKADFKKRLKHKLYRDCYQLKQMGPYSTFPNYLWFVCLGFNPIDLLPDYAGLVVLQPHKRFTFDAQIIKRPPKLHGERVGDRELILIGRWLSYKLKNLYVEKWLNE